MEENLSAIVYGVPKGNLRLNLWQTRVQQSYVILQQREEAEWVARHKKITVNIKDEASLRRWKQKCNFHGKRKFVSFGGWIEIEGLPFSCGTRRPLSRLETLVGAISKLIIELRILQPVCCSN
ncbi:hypothetical protein M0R45_008240 [Rubus argutus]|uniref:Uncharacterized protein n=1 Tax=Rubus argutus TaxID=59490 RepID=A0AAW1Y072_RUBAR